MTSPNHRQDLKKIDILPAPEIRQLMIDTEMISKTGWFAGDTIHEEQTLKDRIDGELQPGFESLYMAFHHERMSSRFELTLTVTVIDADLNQKETEKDFMLADPNRISESERNEIRKHLESFGFGLEKQTWSIVMMLKSYMDLFEEHDAAEYNRLWPEAVYQQIREEYIDPDAWIVNYPYKIDFDNGKLIKKYTSKKDEYYDETISDLVVITAEYQDMASDDEIHLKYLIKKGNKKTQQFLMPASKIGQELLDEVRRRAFIIYGEEKNFMKFLTTFAMYNRDEGRLYHYYFSSRTGWIKHAGREYFMLGNRIFDIDNNKLTDPVPVDDLNTEFEDFFAGIGNSGNYNAWVKNWIPALQAADAAGEQIFLTNTNLWFTIYALAASMIMNFFPGLENTLIINSGTTSRGKSTIAKITASLFGNPKKFITLGSGTANGIWDAWKKWDNLPSVMDEFTNTDPKIKEKIPYWFADGQEKARLDKNAKAKKTREFRKIGYISLENDFLNKIMRTGIDARVIPIWDGLNLPESPDEKVNVSRAAIIDELARVQCYQHYGFYKYEFLKTVAQVGRDQIMDIFDAAGKIYTNSNDALQARLGSSFALFHTAGILAELTNVRLKIRDDVDEIEELVRARCEEVLNGTIKNIGDHDWQVVLTEVLARADGTETRTRWLTDEQLMFAYHPDADSIRYTDRIEAWFINDGLTEFVDVAPDVIRGVCQSVVGRPSMNNVLKEWADRDIIRPLKEDTKTVQQRHFQVQGGNKIRTMVYRINLNKAKELSGYDLTYRRRELLNEIQSEVTDFEN